MATDSNHPNPEGCSLTKERELVAVVVLGDIGHSPRMNYHASSLSSAGYEVNLIGYYGSKPQIKILADDHITLTYMKQCPTFVNYLPRLLAFPLKVFWQSLILFFTLLTQPIPSKLLLQNPPAVPSMPVCWLYCKLKRVKFLIDWHNYGHSILGLTLNPNHPIVCLYRFIEQTFGRKANGGFCVTKAMKEDLRRNWHIDNIIVHYDRPTDRFRPLTNEEKHDFYMKYSSEYPCFAGSSPDRNIFTERFADGRVAYLEDRPALIVSSTSWTEDEDFSILFYALNDYEKVRSELPENYPQLIVVVTGKGPMKDYYISQILEQKWQHVVVITPWLTAEDYPKLLAAADLGVCLHYSSSGLDLPMKVVDMFGCRLPVAAISYNALPELVHHNINGLIFKNKEELSNLLRDWFRAFPKETEIKETYYDFYKNIDQFRKLSWQSSWECNVLPSFKECVK